MHINAIKSYLGLWVSLLLVSLSVFSPLTQATSLTAQVDKTTLSLDDSLVLTITLDQQGAGNLDTDDLELQFDILSRRRNSQASIVNGRIAASTQWVMIIAPKESGQLTIPSFSIAGAFSDPITLTINEASNNSSITNRGDADVFLESSIDKSQVYVQEQILYTFKLFYKVSLSDYSPKPISDDAFTSELVAEKNTPTTINGIRYNILELVYALHPQRSGTIELPSQTWEVQKAIRSFGLGRIDNPYVRVRSQAHSIEVLPVPDKFSNGPWLPAKKVTLESQWEQSPLKAKVGEPLTYQLKLSAQGLSHAQLPEIVLPEINGITVYQDQPETSNTINEQGFLGQRSVNYAIIPKQSGSFEIPPMTLNWWNTETQQMETISLAPQRLVVGVSNLTSSQSNTGNIPDLSEINNLPGDVQNLSPNNILWQIISLIFATLTLLFAYLWLQQKFRLQTTETNSKTLKNNDKQSQKNSSLPRIYKEIEKAIERQQWHQLRQLILKWGQQHSGQIIKKLADVEALYPETSEALKLLDKQLYSPDALIVWNFKELIPLLKKQTFNQKTTNKLILKELY